jgi:hypothetical protein
LISGENEDELTHNPRIDRDTFGHLDLPKCKLASIPLIRMVVATLAFGLRPRQGGCEVAGLEVDPGVTSHAPGSAKSPESVRE